MNAGKQAAGPLDGAVVIAASLVLAIAVLALATPCSVEDPERSSPTEERFRTVLGR